MKQAKSNEPSLQADRTTDTPKGCVRVRPARSLGSDPDESGFVRPLSALSGLIVGPLLTHCHQRG